MHVPHHDRHEALAPFEERITEVLARAARVRSVADPLGPDMLSDVDRIIGAASGLRDQVRALAAGQADASNPKLRHDLRTPLNHILGYGEMLVQEAADEGRADLRGDLDAIVLAGRHVLKHMDDLVRAVRASTPAPAPQRRSSPPSGGQVCGHVLVVDDDESSRELFRRQLELAGHEVTSAASGREALELLERTPVDLVLLSRTLPGMDGPEVLRRLRAASGTRRLPVVMLGGADEVASMVQCIELGADDYLTKPSDPVLLQARVGASLERKLLRDREVRHLEQLETERRRAYELLHVIFPAPIVEELERHSRVVPRRHEDVAVLFCDIVGFTGYSEAREPEEVVGHLQRLVEAYEACARHHGLLKIKTIGDSFMAVANLHPPLPSPVIAAARCGLDMLEIVRRSDTGWSVRIGIHVGPVVAGVLGRERYQYDLWGDTVNTASRVESAGTEGCVTLSESAWERIMGTPGTRATSVGAVRLKGKDPMTLYRLLALP